MRRTLHALQGFQGPFSIVQAYSGLSPRAKRMLCDQLFTEGPEIFSKAVKHLWSQAGAHDVKKLESFLQLLKQTAP